MPDWKPIRRLSCQEQESVRDGKCWFNSLPCRMPYECSHMIVRCRRELEFDCDRGYYGPEHMKPQ